MGSESNENSLVNPDDNTGRMADSQAACNTSQDNFTLYDHHDLAFAGNFFYVTEQINVLLVGKSQSGKSAILEALKNPRFHASKSGFAVTREPECFRMVLYVKAAEKVYQVNMIDTPGLKEVTKNSADQREDNVLLDLAQLCIKSSVTTLNCICFVSEASRTHQNDIDVFRQLMEFLGEEFSENSVMILTHADSFTENRLNDFKSDIEQHEKTQRTYQFCKLGVLYQGIVDFDELQTYKTEDLRSQIMNEKLEKLAPLRRRLVECFISTIGKQKIVGKLHRIMNAAEETENLLRKSQLLTEHQHERIQLLQEELTHEQEARTGLEAKLQLKDGELTHERETLTELGTQLKLRDGELTHEQETRTGLEAKLHLKEGELTQVRTELETQLKLKDGELTQVRTELETQLKRKDEELTQVRAELQANLPQT